MKSSYYYRPIGAIVAWLLLALCCSGQTLTVATDKSSGVYHLGDTVHWQIQWKANGNPPTATYVLKSGGRTIVARGDVSFENYLANVQSTFAEPNTMLLEVTWNADGKLKKALAGAVAAPERIAPAEPPPADFDAFWQSKLDELAAVPANTQLESAESKKSGVDYWKITMDNIRGTQIHGQLARPQREGKFPALLILQYAGVYALQQGWVTDRAAEGWLALNIEPHDLPIDKPPPFYKEQSDGPLKNYWKIGNNDPDQSYYLRMYLSCYRAVEYLKQRDDWNGKTLVVMGTSQGGQQTLMIAGLHPENITAIAPFLPAACDMLAPKIGRAAGFPDWYAQIDGKDGEKVRSASRYYDPVNFARHIQCPVLSGLGLLDDLAPPSSVLAALIQIRAPKEVLILPNAGHQDERGSQRMFPKRLYGAWLPALREGSPAPVQQGVPQTNATFAAAHAALVEKAKQGGIDVYVEGDSITRRWQATDYPEHQKNWDENFFGWNAADFGWGGDTTRNVLFRLNDGELDGVHPKVIVLMIGTNNVGKVARIDDHDLVEEVAQGIRAIVDVFQIKAPDAKVILMGITPRSDAGEKTSQVMATIDKINGRIARLANGNEIRYLNINGQLTDERGNLLPGMTEDGLHLSVRGYQVWADALKPIFIQLLGPPAATDHAPAATGIPKQSKASSS